MKHIRLIVLISALGLAACLSQPTEVPLPTSTSQPTPTATRFLTATLSPSPTAALRFIDLKTGGFSLTVQPGLEFDLNDSSINLSDAAGGLVISLNGRDYIESSYTVESFLGKYLTEMESRGGAFIRGEVYTVEINNVEGRAVDFMGRFLDTPVNGKAFAISPEANFIVFGLGMASSPANQNEWQATGSAIFEELVASIQFTATK